MTYVCAGGIVLLLPIVVFIYRINSEGLIDSASAAFDNASLLNILGNLFLGLFLTLFFQYIFNKTMGLKRI